MPCAGGLWGGARVGSTLPIPSLFSLPLQTSVSHQDLGVTQPKEVTLSSSIVTGVESACCLRVWVRGRSASNRKGTDGQLLRCVVVSAFGWYPSWKMHVLVCGWSSVQVLCLFAWKMRTCFFQLHCKAGIWGVISLPCDLSPK